MIYEKMSEKFNIQQKLLGIAPNHISTDAFI